MKDLSRDLYPQDDPRFVATRAFPNGDEEGIGRSNDLETLMDSLKGDENVIYIYEDMDDEMVLRATWNPGSGLWERATVETEMDVLQQAQELLDQLSMTKLAACAKFCMLRLSEKGVSDSDDDDVTLAELDTITDTDPELD